MMTPSCLLTNFLTGPNSPPVTMRELIDNERSCQVSRCENEPGGGEQHTRTTVQHHVRGGIM
jgi:hypothetical protein